MDNHIRYLNATDDGILRLPEVKISNTYQDSGFYICNVSNDVPDYYGNIYQQGITYIESKGMNINSVLHVLLKKRIHIYP